MRALLSVVFALCLPALAYGQPTAIDRLTPPLPTAGEQRAADVASWVTVGTVLSLDAWDAWHQEDRVQAFVVMGVRVGLIYGLTSIVKEAFPRERPCAPVCGLDHANGSFYSMHTAFAFSAIGGPRLVFVLPLAMGTGGLRILADKHYLTDVLVGAAVGAATSRIR
jgi:membrane-associated phospholipid phosphatase